jgi:hypothetical protein
MYPIQCSKCGRTIELPDQFVNWAAIALRCMCGHEFGVNFSQPPASHENGKRDNIPMIQFHGKWFPLHW